MAQETLDVWQQALAEKKYELEACQRSRQLTSCMACENILDCDVRESYVKAVYDSMSKGTGGGFEF
ncbi:MAG TPA: hypothetical protein PLH07_08845 [Sulfurovum sp.]|jgi:hypothetical protein|nr:MAG: hypothetical protein B7Y63_04365 [Sulfurovum sp. 35-42-20]OYY57654.1 MAG: hypothetical protein B7Y52_00375 [Sulfurovum sp. 28-43-6]OYZ24936.1 MAG: hypothetical protein B7Y23_07740 [Sulfurovum sp. 16-42-52]OYZ50623.1 MAG: hypothetical protein B7Y13_00020 [Sulfurovum sp. 24-42-9]OZA47181.1 MAG: hypothetical protein B7X80_00820 [Sulfurovum sp. 17-42-90]OZA60931.1 MAG: hypothetical protein B7X69_02100 [Sulfurovum sp. 39-42-12]HQR74077.1 hypothetical protein [Sulfurovum sp.]